MAVLQDRLTGIRSNVSLAPYTTIGLGGSAKYFISCPTVDEICSAIEFGRSENLPIVVLGGGSNIIFPDEGFEGLVIKIDYKGIHFEDDGSRTVARVNAGEGWDDFVKLCVEKDLAGVECLSGIPGSVGATPIQNVGAYGQEVRDTIVSVKAINIESLKVVELNSGRCEFGYRNSRFKTRDKNKFVIVEAGYKLMNAGGPTVKYDELREYIELRRKRTGNGKQETEELSLNTVREAVLALRKKKSMIIDRDDPNSKSVGSFFVNPILSEVEYKNFKERLVSAGIKRAPSYRDTNGIKISAAWLVENSGFQKGYKRNGVGISSNHSLALVNYSGTAREILSLASDIENAVFEKFGVKLQKEAVIV
ncbi:MAG TPA: UDP-N-acetylmuramate dehydrogenase [Candidatus Acidoferrales bacterium]|nr:UDP-N-acetylmuramate dehydrogenase [Candidatus Acidoferrales bacterium]